MRDLDLYLRQTTRRNDAIRSDRTTNYTIKSIKYNRFAHVIPNFSLYPELNQHPEYLAKLRSCLRNNLHNSCQQSIVELHSQTMTMDWIFDMYDYGYEALVFWPDGTWPLGGMFEWYLADLMDVHWDDKWLCAGMIVNKLAETGEYPYWDYSYPVVLNLKKWAEIGYPYLIETKTGAVSFETFEKEAKKDTCPRYMFRSGLYKVAKERGIFLDGMIGTALKSDCWVRGFKGEEILDHIHSDDPRENVEDVLSWIHKKEIVNNQNINQIRKFSDKFDESRLELFTLKLLKYQIVYITNTEGIPKDYKFNVPTTPFETLVLPCSGLHQFYHIINNIDSVKRVVWFDFNPYSVKWMRHLLENWDGKNFKKFVDDTRSVITEDAVILDQNIIYEPELVDEFMETLELDDSSLEKIFLKIKKLDHEYLNIDAVKEWKKLAKACGENSNVFIQLTNIWQYEVNYMNTDGLDAQLAFLNLLNTVAKNNTALFLTGDTPMGIHYRYKNIKQLKGVF